MMMNMNANNKNIIVNDLYIEYINNILVCNYKTLYYFLSLFNDKSNSTLFINNYKIDSKNSIIVNLYDMDSILSQTELKKGSLIYDCLISDIGNQIEESNVKENIEMQLNSILTKIFQNSLYDFKYNIDVDVLKIISSYVNMYVDYSLEEYTQILKKILMYVIENNPRKRIILLVNAKLFKTAFDDIDNIIIFKFESDEQPNIILLNETINFDYNLVCNNLMLNWPCDIIQEEAIKYINSFVNIITTGNYNIDDYKVYIACDIISKCLNVNMKINLTEKEEIPQLYKKYIDTLLLCK